MHNKIDADVDHWYLPSITDLHGALLASLRPLISADVHVDQMVKPISLERAPGPDPTGPPIRSGDRSLDILPVGSWPPDPIVLPQNIPTWSGYRA